MTELEHLSATSKSVPTKRLSIGKRCLFGGLTVFIGIGLIELASMAIWFLIAPIKLADYQQALTNVAQIGTERKNDLEVLHPYLGWVFNPDASSIPTHLKALIPVNSLGFVDTGPTVLRRSPERFIVGIFGGSVAQQLGTIGEQAFRDRLAACPALRGREIQIVRLAMSGYKQPQQLIALNYVLALGGEFDAVINIDGYNETSLVVGENNEGEIFAAYPRMWSARLQDVVDPRNSSLSYRLLQNRATRQSRAQWIRESLLRRTWTGSLVWATQDTILRNRQTDLGVELVETSRKQGHGFARQGPKQLYSNPDQMYDHLTALWKNCSLQMYFVCQGRGIRYMHVLQPNQYLTDSKPLSPLEIDKYYTPKETHAQAVTIGYPRLIATGAELQDSGVAFRDATQLFAQITDTIYSDYFCHYNTRGTNMLAELVAEKLAETLTSE